VGPEFFDNTREQIDEYKTESRIECQTLVEVYVVGLIQALHSPNLIEASETKRMQTFAYRTFIDCVTNADLEAYLQWVGILGYLLQDCDLRKAKQFFTFVQSSELAMDRQHAKYHRILQIVAKFAQCQGYLFHEQLDCYLKEMLEAEPLDIKQATEYAKLLKLIIEFDCLSPFSSRGLEACCSSPASFPCEKFEQLALEDGNVVREGGFLYFRRNSTVRRVVEKMVSRAKSDSQVNRRKYILMVNILSELFLAEHRGMNLLWHLVGVLEFYLNFEVNFLSLGLTRRTIRFRMRR